MKILMVTMSMNIGGAETHILELCRELSRLGHDISLASFGGVYADEAQKCGIKHYKLPLHSKQPNSLVKAYNGLEKIIIEGQFDIVHAHARIPAFLCGLLHDRLTFDNGVKFRFVTTAHLNFTNNALLRKISRWGERVMAVSDDITDYLVDEFDYPRDKIHVTINGIDTEKFSENTDFSTVLEKHSLEESHRRIVYMSRLDEDRADPAFRLLNIAPKIAEKYPDSDIIIVGGGNVFDKIKNQAHEVNITVGRQLVTVTGAVSNTNEYCAAATVFIGVSRSALEAMASSKPVIVAGNQGSLGIFDETKIKPAIDTNFCCRGFGVADENVLFDYISTLFDKPDVELKTIGDYNRAFILEHYTAHRMAKDYLAMYERTLASPLPINPKKSNPDVVLSGYYGFGNLGDESLLDIITESLAREMPDIKIAALTKSPKKEMKRTGLGCVSRFDYFALKKIINRSTMLISGGGSLLQDKTSKRSLGYYTGVISVAENLCKKVTVLANGIGPISHEPNRKRAASVVSRAEYVSVRDRESAEELLSLGITKEKITLTADPAFLIRPASDHSLSRVISSVGLDGKRFFAVSVRPLHISRFDSAKISSADEHYLAEIRKFCTVFSQKTGLVPLIVPMQKTQDLPVCDHLIDSLASDGVKAYKYIPDSAPLLIAVLGKAEFLVGMRLHSVIFASSVGCPVIGLSYDPKVSAMMAELGQKYSVDITRGDDFADALAGYAEEITANRDEISRLLLETGEEMRRRSLEDMRAVKDILGK